MTSLLDIMPDNGLPGSPSAIRRLLSLLDQDQAHPTGAQPAPPNGLLRPTPPFAASREAGGPTGGLLADEPVASRGVSNPHVEDYGQGIYPRGPLAGEE